MGVVWYAARPGLVRHRRSLLLLAVLIAVAGSIVLSAAAGARRTSTVVDRFVDATLARDAGIQIDDPDRADSLLGEIEALEMVAASARVAFAPVYPNDYEGELDAAINLPVDGRFGRDLERPLIIEGRLPDPAATDEVIVNELFADQSGWGTGDRFSVTTFTPDDLTSMLEGAFQGFNGPVVELEIVGIGRQGSDIQGSDIGAGGTIIGTQALAVALDGEVGMYRGMQGVRLVEGATYAEFRAAVAEIMGPRVEYDIVSAAIDFEDGARAAADVLSRALWAFAVVAGVAAAVVIGGAVSRQHLALSSTAPVLAALGLDRRRATVVLAAPVVLASAVGAAGAVVGAAMLSDRFPIGVTRPMEPMPGIDVDGLVLGAGALSTVLACAAWVAVLSVRRPTGHQAVGRRSVDQRRLPLLPGLGLAHAFGRSGSRGAGSGVVAAGLGVAGAVAIVVTVASLDALAGNPARFGFAWDAEPDVWTESPQALEEVAADVLGVGGVDAAAIRHNRRVELGGVVVEGVAFQPVGGPPIGPVMRSGTAPQAAGEVALGQRTADTLGVGVGDDVVAGLGVDGITMLRVVGIAVLPPVESIDPATGAVLTPEGLATVARSGGFRSLVLQTEDGRRIEEDALLARSDLLEFSRYSYPREPGAVANLVRARPVLVALGVFFGGLGAAGIGHALVVGVRRRSRELATLRALGMERRQLRSVVRWTAVTLASIGVVVGLPLGLVAGRAVWQLMAGGLGLVDHAAWPLVGLAAAGPVAVGAALVLGLWPSHRAGNIDVADLRPE